MTDEVHKSEYFDEFLDEQDLIEVAGMQFQPSDVLYNLAPEQYRVALTEFRESIWPERLGEIISTGFPRPIAFPFQKYSDDTLPPNTRLTQLRDCWEGLLGVIFSLIFGECISGGCVIQNRAITLRRMLSDKISDRLTMIEHLIEEPDLVDPKPSLIEHLDSGILEKIRVLNSQHRNAWSHEVTLTDKQIEQELSSIEPRLLELMESVLFLKDCQLVRYLRSGQSATDLVFEDFAGAGLAPPNITLSVSPEVVASAGQLLSQRRLICYTGSHFTGLAPFCHFEEDDEGHITRFLMFRRKGNGAHSGEYQYSAVAGRRAHYVPTAEFSEEMSILRRALGLSATENEASNRTTANVEGTE